MEVVIDSKIIPFKGMKNRRNADPTLRRIALRTAFIARFIVLREGRRSKAHRIIEAMTWLRETGVEEIYQRIRQAFLENGDKLSPVDRDLKRALEHAERSVDYFIEQYVARGTESFREALIDYEKTNALLFGESTDLDPTKSNSAAPRTGGWRPSGAVQIGVT
jgi:hypothetical protein